ncbi:nuclear factor 7, ovary-like [Cynoglossus semilaevis]|uniref:nuclear factor 7, ovary-like n=1 Tax=Cynoglossus semilaevis TaxID=244447 RepID=UPI000494E87A|nr:nuclear factor 7, ovary-like [Cynoglossus semilaevis]
MAHRFANDLICPVCFEIFKDPVLLSCSHSFCKKCLDSWWADKVVCTCPVCNQNPSGVPASNLVLKNLCEALSGELSVSEDTSAGSEALCNLHSEKLRLYCLDHQQPMCVVCRESRAHFNHSFKPIDECADDYRDSLRTSLKPLQQNLNLLSEAEVKWNLTAEHIKMQGQNTEESIKEEFQKLRCFLQQEEESRIAAVRAEAEQKSSAMKRTVETLSREIKRLKDIVEATEEELRATDVEFLNKYRAASERLNKQPLLKCPMLTPGTLINMTEHVGNLTDKVWQKMKDMVTYSPVILDPNTTVQVVSKDLTSLTYTNNISHLPENPERFKNYILCLGSESFNSGIHYWDVEVGNDRGWSVGLIKDSVDRKAERLTGYWELWLKDGLYRASCPPHIEERLTLTRPIRKVRVHLDWEGGKLKFINLDTNTTIYTFVQTFTEKLYPFFDNSCQTPLRILPAKVNMKLTI